MSWITRSKTVSPLFKFGTQIKIFLMKIDNVVVLSWSLEDWHRREEIVELSVFSSHKAVSASWKWMDTKYFLAWSACFYFLIGDTESWVMLFFTWLSSVKHDYLKKVEYINVLVYLIIWIAGKLFINFR